MTTRTRVLARALDDAKARQRGVDDAGATILRGVFDLERRPDAATRRRLAKQIGATEQAVHAWFRSRRAKMKRDRARRALLVALVVVGAAAGAYYAWNATRQTAAARRRMETLGKRYKHMTRSGLPRPYADRTHRERYGTTPLTVEKEKIVTLGGREDERAVRYTKENPKTSPLTKKPETPRQKLERIRAEAAKKANKGRLAPRAQPNALREPKRNA
jgi:hypothetical protein